MKHLIASLFVAQTTLFIPSAIAERLLVDDFSIPQQGIETDQFAAFDLLEDPGLFGGGREILGGGAGSPTSNCSSSTYTVEVAGGVMSTTVSTECFGVGAVTWPKRDSTASLDLSPYSAIQIDIAELVGEIDTRITFDSNITGNGRLNVLLDTTGLHTFIIPESIALSSVRRLTVASLVGRNEFLTINAVWLVVPEPATFAIAIVGIAFIGLICRRD